ncbi:MAG TPA: 50S ribosomal protein L10 [Nitrospiria bacterium]
MNREQKNTLVSEFNQKFLEANLAILTDYSGLTVEEFTSLRRELRPNQCEFRVVKNTLAKRALTGTPFEDAQAHLKGPVAVAFGFGDPVASTKILSKFSKTQKKLKIKFGIIEGQVLDSKGVETVASLPSREVLLGLVVNRMQSPIYGMVGVLSQLVKKFGYVLSAVKEKKEGENT